MAPPWKVRSEAEMMTMLTQLSYEAGWRASPPRKDADINQTRHDQLVAWAKEMAADIKANRLARP